MNDKSKRLMGMNVYITNTSLEEVPTNYVHSLYSLRWQSEILFKMWKSFFEIDECKNIKRERLECDLYDYRLLSVTVSSDSRWHRRTFKNSVSPLSAAQKNGRKCHRYKKMTVFDILGIVYKTTVKHRQAA